MCSVTDRLIWRLIIQEFQSNSCKLIFKFSQALDLSQTHFSAMPKLANNLRVQTKEEEKSGVWSQDTLPVNCNDELMFL